MLSKSYNEPAVQVFFSIHIVAWVCGLNIIAHLAQVLVFPVVMYGCESWTIKRAECRKIDAFFKKKLIYLLLKDNCFTEFCCFLSNLNMNCDVGEDSWESLELQEINPKRVLKEILKEISPECSFFFLNVHWKDWCWSWSTKTLATWCEELTRWKRPWCWERLKAGGEGDDRGWDGWMASLTQWTWVWVNSRSWWWTGRPGVLQSMWLQVLQSMGLQRVNQDWATELKWTEMGNGELMLTFQGMVVRYLRKTVVGGKIGKRLLKWFVSQRSRGRTYFL